MRSTALSAMGYLGFTAFMLGCGSQPGDPPEGVSGSMRAAIELGPTTHDVTAVRFDLVPADGECDAPALATHTAPIEAELAPAATSGADTEQHHFASSLFTAAPGDYRVCATPLRDDAAPSDVCASASASITVVAEQTSEAMLVSQCQGAPGGGVDVTVTLNDPPRITDVTVTDSTYVTVCETARIAVSAEDPNGDALSYGWSVVSGPDGGSLSDAGANATFSGPVGDYVLRVEATDTHGAVTSFLFTVHVADATCFVAPEVQAILVGNCAPCHTTGASGGLKLDPADVAYASLVNHNAGAADCSSQVRVIPGDSQNSYLMAKLQNAPGICGAAMPRNRPPLGEQDLQTIADWIDSLPH
jgi:hypothetical protein